MLKILIVDDEKPARMALRALLTRDHSAHQIVGEAADLPQAILMIREQKPDLVFLDIEMPVYSGLEIMRFFDEQEINFRIVFLTGYDQYALAAFEIAALDYLLKPLDSHRLAKALDRAVLLAPNPNNPKAISLLRGTNLVVKTLNTIEILPKEDIVYIMADGSYCNIVSINRPTLTVSKRIGHFENALTDNNFFRIHRSVIANLIHVVRFHSKDMTLEMKNGAMLAVSQSAKEALLQWFA